MTPNLGVRYDLEPRVNNPDLEDPIIDPQERKIIKNNFAPRVGFTYDLSGDGRTIVRGGAGRYYGNILLNIPMNEQRDRKDRVAVSLVNPIYGDPLQGRTLEDFLRLNLPRARTVLAHDFRTPMQDQFTIGLARQMGDRYAAQFDIVHTLGRDLMMSRNINQFDDPATHLPLNTVVYGRPYPQFTTVTLYESSGRSRYDGLQFGFSGRRGKGRYSFQGSYTLSWTKGHTDANRFGSINNPFNVDDEYTYMLRDQRHRFTTNATLYLPWDVQMSTIFFAGSPKPINIATSLDPFRMGATGRWLDASGRVLPKNGERTRKNDYKLDIRLSKTLRTGRVSVQAMADIFNVLNTANWDRDFYGRTYGTATYLQPGSSTNLFFQPRQVQFGFRVTY